MANITSILVGNKFIKVNLSVYDNDGMEGFYVPESTFREMVKDASASVANQSINFDTGGSTGISAEPPCPSGPSERLPLYQFGG